MKKILFIILLFIFSNVWAYSIEDDSIIKELENNSVQTKETNLDFHLKNFNSCNDLEQVIWKYIKDYWKNHKNRYLERPMIMYDVATTATVRKNENIQTKQLSVNNSWWKKDFSKTNTQVNWVDEADIIKTDWDYIYYYNSKWEYNTNKYIYIIDAKDKNNLKIVKKIKTPTFFHNIKIFLKNDKLVILANWYSNHSYKNYWISRNQKTYVIVYNIKDKTQSILEKLYVVDWDLKQSRMIGKYLYVISNNYFHIPYYSFKKEEDIKIDINKIVPKKLDITKTKDKKRQNLKIKWKTYPFNIKAWNVAKCNEIEYVLPDTETLKKYDFRPSYNIISIINVEDSQAEVKTKVIAWNSSEIYMSLDNLYLTDRIYSPYNYKCPDSTKCIMPYYYWWTTNTLIHKLAISWNNLEYKTSNIIPWNPLNQYSMDEKDSLFRIITYTNRWNWKTDKSHSDLYILDKNLKLYSSIKNIWETEKFQSSRFIWDKLFLVTFKQIDPLFVIDLADQKNPKIIGELKIPGYSKYLHPYDENHLIGLGFDTYENKWWWTSNGWIKVDLYEVNYDKTDKNNKDLIEVKQLQSLVFGDSGSYTDAMRNPRMFMWNKKKNLLLLPANLYKNESKDSYKHIDFFQGLIAINIEKSWIKEKYRISHLNREWLEKKRQEECAKYLKQKEEKQKCRKLIDWTEYCPPKNSYYYIPNYCFADTTVWTYIAHQYWKFQNSFIQRALWIDNSSFAISNDKITSHNLDNWYKYFELKMK